MSVRLHALRHRRRIVRVSIFQHHGSWWLYHRAGGNPCRWLIGESLAKTGYEASLLNASLVHEVPKAVTVAADRGVWRDAGIAAVDSIFRCQILLDLRDQPICGFIGK
jgi:hypothetical protein